MDQLIERVLPVSTRLAPNNRTCLPFDVIAFEVDVLAIALHLQLLQISWEALHVVRVGHDADGLRAEKVVVPHGQKSHQRRQVLLQRRGAKMLIHIVEAGEQIFVILGTNSNHG